MITLSDVNNAFPLLKPIADQGRIGGQKKVFKANLGGKPVALKLFLGNEADRERTERETAAVAKIQSNNIPTVFDYGRRLVGTVQRSYIVEEFVEGSTLRDVLSRRTLTHQEVLTLGSALLSACAACELAGIVHRDIKPENIVISDPFNVWLVDFGFARHLDLTSLTPSGLYNGVGTVGYAPPEQFRNIKADIDVRADLYAVGVVLYECVHGRNPWREGAQDVVAVLQRMESEELPPLQMDHHSDLRLSEFVSWLTQRFPSRRPQSASEAIKWYQPLLKKESK